MRLTKIAIGCKIDEYDIVKDKVIITLRGNFS